MKLGCKNFIVVQLFFTHFLLQIHKTVWDGRRESLFLSTISTHSQTFKHLFVVLHMRWLSLNINHGVQNALQELCSCSMRFTNILKLAISIYLFTSWQALLEQIPKDRWWTWTHINYHFMIVYHAYTSHIYTYTYYK